ncbi:hypothetical protein Tco_1540453 [Tanacetum coccineum]
MVPPNKLGHDLNGKAVNKTQYRGMIGSLLYLTASRPDIQFSTCLCARYQANPKESHLIDVKRIFRKSTPDACQLLRGKLVCWSAKKQQYVAMSSAKAEYVAATGCCANILWMKSQLTDYDIIYERHNITPSLNLVQLFKTSITREAFTRSTTMYKEYLVDFLYNAKVQESQRVWFSTPYGVTHGEVGLTSFRNAIGANYIEHLRDYAQTPSIEDVRDWFPSIGYGEEIETKGTLKNTFLPPRTSLHRPHVGRLQADAPVAFKAPRTSSHTEKKDSQGKKPGAKSGHTKQSSSKHPSVSSIEATKGGSSKAPTGSKIGHSKRKKESSSAMDSNPSQPPLSTPVDLGMHKEDQQATGDPTSLGATTSFIIHSKFALGYDASVDSTAEADPGKSAPNDSLPTQQGKDEGTKSYSLDHTFAGTNPNVLEDKTHSISEGLETVLTQTNTRKRANTIAGQFEEDEA